MNATFQRTVARLLWGAASGAVGTVALNAVTYGDMLLRGRASSGAPAQMAGTLADYAGIDVLRSENDNETAANRRSAAGALLGYTTGVGIGVVYAAMRNDGGKASPFGAGVMLGLAATAASDVPLALTGTSDPRTWSGAAWLSDLIPHLAYGLATATTFEQRNGSSE